MTPLPAPAPEEWTFFLGTHEVGWLQRGVGPLFVSHRRLKRRARLPRATAPWALDSGGFTELRLHGGWQTSVDEYLQATRRYAQEVGGLQFAFSMDWMCEPAIIKRTGLTIYEHQRRTVANFAELRGRAPDLPFAPVLQGWRISDYVRCAELYRAWGFDLTREPRGRRRLDLHPPRHPRSREDPLRTRRRRPRTPRLRRQASRSTRLRRCAGLRRLDRLVTTGTL